MIDWNDLRYLLSVARDGSTIAAGKALRVSQSTVHRRLADLEKRLGRKVVKRHPTGYRLTDFGETLRPLVEQVAESVAAVERCATAAESMPTGTIRVTCSESIGYRLMRSAVLSDFQKRYSELRVELVMSDHVLDIAKGEADIAVRAGEPDDDRLVGRKIADVPWALYASRSYVKLHGQPDEPAAINRHAIIEFDGDIKEHHAAKWLRSFAPDPRVAGRCSSILGLLIAVASGAGIAPLPLPLAARDPDLVRLLGPLPGLFSPIYLLTHPDLRRAPRISAFFEYIIADLDRVRPVLMGDAGAD